MKRRDRGMTLIELVVAVAIAGVIFAALTEAMMIGLKTLDSTNKRLNGSNDTFLVASYFTSDVEGASYLATNGTRAHVTPAVALPAAASSLKLVSAYAVSGTNSVFAPASQATVWNACSASSTCAPASASGVTSSLADESLTVTDDNRSDTLARVATTTNPTSSISHTIALTATGKVTPRPWSSGAVPNGNSLVLSKPSGLSQGDVMVAHITASTSASNVTTPAGWGPPVQQRDLSPTLTSLLYVRTAGASEPGSWAWGFRAGSGTHDIAGGVVAYTNISTASPLTATTANPCGGGAPVLAIATSDRFAVSATGYFFETSGLEHQLVRHACTAAGVESRQVLARELQDVTGATASCVPAGCDPVPASATLVLREPPLPHDTSGRSYELSARTRTG